MTISATRSPSPGSPAASPRSAGYGRGSWPGGRAGCCCDPLLLGGQRPLPGALLLLFLLQPLALLLQPGGVIALERVAAAALDLEDPVGDVVEEVAVVGDDHHRAREVAQRALEPGDALGVEVVGRLVEQQQVGLLEQQPAQRDAAPLAARELADARPRPAGSAARRARCRCVRSSSQPSSASIFSCSSACSASSAFISSSAIGSANASLIALKRSIAAFSPRTPA